MWGKTDFMGLRERGKKRGRASFAIITCGSIKEAASSNKTAGKGNAG